MDSSILLILYYYTGIVCYIKGSCMCLKEPVCMPTFKFAAFISNISISAFKSLGADLWVASTV